MVRRQAVGVGREGEEGHRQGAEGEEGLPREAEVVEGVLPGAGEGEGELHHQVEEVEVEVLPSLEVEEADAAGREEEVEGGPPGPVAEPPDCVFCTLA